MTLAELSVLIPLTLGVLALVVKAFIPAKKSNPGNHNPGNPGNNTDSKVAHAVMAEKLDNIAETLQRIEDKLP